MGNSKRRMEAIVTLKLCGWFGEQYSLWRAQKAEKELLESLVGDKAANSNNSRQQGNKKSKRNKKEKRKGKKDTSVSKSAKEIRSNKLGRVGANCRSWGGATANIGA